MALDHRRIRLADGTGRSRTAFVLAWNCRSYGVSVGVVDGTQGSRFDDLPWGLPVDGTRRHGRRTVVAAQCGRHRTGRAVSHSGRVVPEWSISPIRHINARILMNSSDIRPN